MLSSHALISVYTASLPELIPVPSKTQVVVSQTAGNSAYKGGSLTSVIPPSGNTRKTHRFSY